MEAVELGACAVVCGVALIDCLAYLSGYGDGAVCTDDGFACLDCVSGLEIDCGCVLYPCFLDASTGQDLMYVDELYGGTCE